MPRDCPKVRTGYGKLWKLTTPFSRTWKVLEGRFFKVAMETFLRFA